MKSIMTRILTLALCLGLMGAVLPAAAQAESDGAELRVQIYFDSNNNGERGPYEHPVPGVEVTVVAEDGSAVAGPAVSDKDGEAVLTAVPAGTYRVQVRLPEGWGYGKKGTKDKAGSSSVMEADTAAVQLSGPVDFAAGTQTLLGVGAMRMSAISGKAWLDVNEDGMMQADEPGGAGLLVELIGEKNGLIYQAVTGEDGLYRITQVKPGLYKLWVTAPEGTMFTKYSKIGGANRSFFTTEGKRRDGRQVTLVEGEELKERHVGLVTEGALTLKCFLDANYNGLWDEGEEPLPGVECEAIKANNGKTAASGVSDENGVVTLSALRSGAYRVHALLPKDCAFTLVNESGEGNRFYARPGRRENTVDHVAVIAGQTSTLAVGAVIHGTISGVAYLDDDFSAAMDKKEKTVSGIGVALYNGAGEQVAVARTNGKGGYTFADLNPGTYQLRANAKDGYAFTKIGEGNVYINTGSGAGETEPFSLALGQELNHMDMGMIRPGVVEGSVFADSNDNGLWDAEESGLAGTVVRLMEESGEAFSATVGEDGAFRFDAVMPGRYYLRYELPERGALASRVKNGSQVEGEGGVGAGRWFSFDTGSHVEAPLCGGLILGEITATAFGDSNGSGAMDADESPLAGLTLTLTPSRGDLAPVTATSGADGALTFTGLRPDTYTLTAECPEGYVLSRMDGSSLPLRAGVPAAAALTVDMGSLWADQALGCVKPAAIRGTAWLDENNDGFRGEDEKIPAGRVVEVIDQITGETVAEMPIGEDGVFAAEGLIPGLYTLRYSSVTPKAGDCTFIPGSESDMVMRDVRLEEGGEATGMVAAVVLYSSMNGRVWVDLGDEIAGMAGAEVMLLDESGAVIQTAVAGEDSTYRFDGLLPGEYKVRVRLPEGHVAVEPGDARLANGGQISIMEVCQGREAQSGAIAVRMGEEMRALDIGAVLPGTLGDLCWLDENGNGLQDTGEGGIPGVKVELMRDGRVVAETVSDAYGMYRFADVYPADYVLRVTAPEGLEPTRQREDIPAVASILAKDGENFVADVTVQSDRHNRNADLGFVLTNPGAYPAGYGEAPSQDWTKPAWE